MQSTKGILGLQAGEDVKNEHMQRNGQACQTCGKYMGMATGKPRECKACVNKTKRGK